jgi:acyl carrier protein
MEINMSYQESVREFIVENFLFGDEEGLENESSFFETGVVDSTGILEIVSFIEEEFEVKVEDEELIPENFSSVVTIDQYLQRKLNGSAN